ncbi:MAG: rod shape-determining protein MreD [Clostridiaceae bacterium]|nr:rod shape-determining protein MreD [Clostridiaceae bacterium]
MKYRIAAAILLLLLVAVVQSSILGYMEIFLIRPNITIVLMVIVALLRKPVESATMGLLLGLTMDIMMGKTLGWYALLLFLASIPISLINEKLYREKVLVLFSFAFSATVAIETLFFLILFLFKSYSYFPFIFMKVILPEALYNSILIIPLFWPVSKLYALLDMLDIRRNRVSS